MSCTSARPNGSDGSDPRGGGQLTDTHRKLGDAPGVRERIGAPALELRDDE